MPLGAFLGGVGMGMINDWRQGAMNDANMKRQIKGQKEMTDYNTKAQLGLWKATGPVGYSKELELAGLSKALMYGGSGAGGQTAAIAQGSVDGGKGIAGGNEFAQAAQMGMMNAQKEVMESQADLNRAQAEKARGAETENLGASTGKLKAETVLAEQKTRQEKITANVMETNENEIAGQIREEAQLVHEELEQIIQNNHILRAQAPALKKQANAQLLNTLADTMVKVAEEKGINANTEFVRKNIEAFAQRLEIEIQDAKNRKQMVTQDYIQKAIHYLEWRTEDNFKTFLKQIGWSKLGLDAIGDILGSATSGGMGTTIKRAVTPKRTPIGFPKR